ncbi:MAG: hypothetical protein O3C23_00770 [bacterium]|nr:hypothetical protein [bacterium]
MIHTVVLSLLAGFAGLWIATEFIPGVSFTGDIKSFLMLGGVLGIIIIVSRPLLNVFSLIIKLVILTVFVLAGLWVLDIIFPEFDIPNLFSLLWTGLAVAGATIVLSLFGRGKV